MEPIDTGTYLTSDDYERAIHVLRQFSRFALSWLREKSSDFPKDYIIGNFIARGAVCLDGIYHLWRIGNYQDCWVLHRTLADRLIHIWHLADRDEFEEFERWSFQRQYDMAHNALSDPVIRDKLQEKWLIEATSQQRQRRERYNREPKSQWRRPQAKDVARAMNLPILYRLSYDTPSMEVHPMADDGKEEFDTLLGLDSETFGDERTVLQNSLVLQFLLIRYGFSAASVRWRSFVNDFMEEFFLYVESGDPHHLLNAVRILAYPTDISWCEPNAQ